jgi:hypothetical protein
LRQSRFDSNGDPATLNSYSVRGNTILGPKPTATDKAIWTRFTQVIPARYRPEITIFETIDGNTGFDGSVHVQDPEVKDVWVLQLDGKGTVSAADLDRTMVHEFAHLLTLRASQIPVSHLDEDAARAACRTFYEDDGCTTKRSYLNRFVEQFWTGKMPFRSGERATSERYQSHRDQFVTEYAATSPAEDIAESFAEYVLASPLPKGDSIANSKILFFSNYPELAKIRNSIRSGAGF